MRTKTMMLCAAILLIATSISSVVAQPYYNSREDYLNKVPAVQQLDRAAGFKTSQLKSALAVPGPPDLDAIWTGATQWMTGINRVGGEVFNGSIGKGTGFFGSNVADGNYVSVRIIFQTGAPNQTLCQTFRRDLGYISAGVGTFPGQAWDISNPGSPRRLNICFVEDNNLAAANHIWDPNGVGAPTYGKREYVFIMLSSYDGTGTTYAGFNANSGASSMDVLYGWWPLVAAGHTFFENQPCTLSIGAYYVKGFVGVPSTNQVILDWRYGGAGSVNHFNIYGGTTSPPSTLLDQVSGSTTRYTATDLTTAVPHYFRIEADDAARSIVGKSKELTITPQSVSQNLDFIDFWNGRGLYGGCWGYTDPSDNKEYALLACRNEGISIIDLGMNPIQEVGFMPLVTYGNDSKEVKVYGDYAIVIAEYEAAQIFNISDPTNPVKVSDVMNITGDGTNGAHNCMVNGNYLYVIGNHDIGGLQIWNIINPAVPVSVGLFQPFYYHDIDIHNDTLIGFGIYGEGIDLVNIANKTAPSLIRRFNYPGSGSHNGEFLQGHKYVAIGDEIGSSGNHTRMFDLRDLNNISNIFDIIVDPNAVAHNCYARNDTLFIAHYSEGVRMWDVSDPFNPTELGYYDSYLPAEYGYLGVWNVFPFFASGKVIISVMQSGLFVLKPPTPLSCCIGIRGDLNGDGANLNVVDLTFAVNRIFRGGPPSACPTESDVNSDGAVLNVLDLTFMVDRIFRGGPAPGPC